VWKIELDNPGMRPSLTSVVRVEHAQRRTSEHIALEAFLERFADYLDGGGRLVEQPYLPRVAEGMVRCYLSGGRVVGFTEHLPRGFVSSTVQAGANAPGLGFSKVMHGPEAGPFQGLRLALESEWVPAMLRSLDMDAASLPAIWDADFLRGDRPPGREPAWVLCEINASCVSPFPDAAAEPIAATTYRHVVARRGFAMRR
jgi:hypothetical protein